MNLRICMCCGEPIAEKGDTFSRNPNVCASCSSLSDGMPESSISSFPDFDDRNADGKDFQKVTAEPVTAFARS
jgi:recombinational DNA repair protein (RecF pathway)